MKTIGEHTKRVLATYPVVITATTSSEPVVDTEGFDNVLYSVAVGDLDLASGNETYVSAVYESANADGSSAVAISGATVSMVADNTQKDIQISGLGTGSRLRYQFIRHTLAGTTPSMPVSSVAILAGARGQLNPADAPDASV